MAFEPTRSRAKLYEDRGLWQLAEETWRALGETEEADICKHINDSIEKGDAYRAEVKEARENSKCFCYEELRSIYKKHYN